MNISIRLPRVARPSQPWAERPCPVGVNPIPAAPASERLAIAKLVAQGLAARGENCGAWESEINARVARLYALTPEEIQLVEESVKK